MAVHRVTLGVTVGDLVGRLRDHRDDPATAQLSADGAAGVRRTAAHSVGSGARRLAAEHRYPQMSQYVFDNRRVVGLWSGGSMRRFV